MCWIVNNSDKHLNKSEFYSVNEMFLFLLKIK